MQLIHYEWRAQIAAADEQLRPAAQESYGRLKMMQVVVNIGDDPQAHMFIVVALEVQAGLEHFALSIHYRDCSETRPSVSSKAEIFEFDLARPRRVVNA